MANVVFDTIDGGKSPDEAEYNQFNTCFEEKPHQQAVENGVDQSHRARNEEGNKHHTELERKSIKIAVQRGEEEEVRTLAECAG